LPTLIECFGCGNRFERDQLEEVGDTVFCRACHARMLRRIDERRARGPDTGAIRRGAALDSSSSPSSLASSRSGAPSAASATGGSSPIRPRAQLAQIAKPRSSNSVAPASGPPHTKHGASAAVGLAIALRSAGPAPASGVTAGPAGPRT